MKSDKLGGGSSSSYSLLELEKHLGYESSVLPEQNSKARLRLAGIASPEEAYSHCLLYWRDLRSPLKDDETFRLATAIFLDESQRRLVPEERFLQKPIFFSKNMVKDFISLLNFFDRYKNFVKFLPLPMFSEAMPSKELLEKSIEELQLIVALDDKRLPYIGPNVICGEQVRLSAGVCLMGNNFLGHQVKLGINVRLGPGVVLHAGTEVGDNSYIHAGSVIGADGFGYEMLDGKLIKVPQIGKVCIGEHVEIGANVCIDKATFAATRIGDRTKIDNLVHIAHNVQIGEQGIIVAQSGIAGSSRIGKRVTLAGQVGISDHVQIEDGAVLGPQTGVMARKKIPKNAKVMGSPASDFRDYLKMNLILRKLAREASQKKS